MHPILTQKGRLALYLIAWVPVTGLLAALLAVPGRLTWAESFAVAAPLCFVYAFICLSAWYICRAFPLQLGVLRLAAIHSATAFLSGSFWVLIARLWIAALSIFSPFAGVADRASAHVPMLQLLAFGILLFSIAVLGNYLLALFEASREAEHRSFDLRMLAREAELKALRAQIDPHFLFNSLNSISALITADGAGARQMCVLLSDFLRNSLQLGAENLITLEQEMALISSFLRIEQVRLGPRLRVATDVDAGAARCELPPLLLQPLVENALRHGIAHVLEGGTVTIEARHIGERLLISISNPCDPDRPRPKGSGIGMENVRNRLVALYGQDARVQAVGAAGHFRVDLSMPARFRQRRSVNP